MNRKLWSVGLFFALIMGFFGARPAFAAPVLASTSYGCASFSASGSSIAMFVTLVVSNNGQALNAAVVPVNGGAFAGTVTYNGQQVGTNLTYVVYESDASGNPLPPPAGRTINTVPCSSTPPLGAAAPPPTYADGRLNTETALPPFVLYCSTGGVSAWTINMTNGSVNAGRGSLAFTAYGSQIGYALAQATALGQNVQISSAYGVSLWALSSYELQAHWSGQGNPYDYIFAPSRCGISASGYVQNPGGSPSYPVNPAYPTYPTYPVNPSYPTYPSSLPVQPSMGVHGTYVVQPGDNLYRISLRFGVNLAVLASVNGIYNYNLIYVGEVLIIP